MLLVKFDQFKLLVMEQNEAWKNPDANNFNTEAKLSFANTSENTTKKRLLSSKKCNKK